MNVMRDPDFEAITEKEIFEEAKDRLQICVDAESDNRTKARNDLKFREGDQWDHDVLTTASEESPELTINLTDSLVRRVVNNMKQQRPRGKCHPVGDGADVETAKIINGIGRHVEYRSEASVAYDIGGEMAVSCGWGYWRILSEYVTPTSFDQDLRILPIQNIFTVYMDPSAIMPTGQDAGWCLLTIKMKRAEYKRLYPNAENVDWKDTGNATAVDDWEDKEEIRLAEYFRIREKSEKLCLVRNKGGGEYTRYKSQLAAPESLEAVGDEVVEERDSVRQQVEWFRLNGTKVVERRVLPGSWIPVIRVQGNAVDIDGRIYRRGMVRAMLDAQRMVNYGEVAKIKRLGLAPKAPWVMAEGQMDGHPEWNDANQKSYSVMVYKPVTIATAQGDIPLPPPQRQPPAQIEAGFSEFVQGMRGNLMALAGAPNEPNAGLQQEVVSGIAQQRRDQLSDMSHFQYYDNQVLAIAHTWRIMLEWIPHYYSGERMQRIIGEDGVAKMVKINESQTDQGITKIKNDMSVGRYDVVMDTGPGYETKREEGATNLINLLKIPPLAEEVVKAGSDLIFRALDYPYMQELADRIVAATPQGLQQIMPELSERAQSIVRSLGGQVQQLQQALQQAQMEIKTGMVKAQLEGQIKAKDSQLNAVTKIHDTNTRAQTARDIEEIRAGAAILDTHMKRRLSDTVTGDSLISTGEKPTNGGSNAASPGQ